MRLRSRVAGLLSDAPLQSAGRHFPAGRGPCTGDAVAGCLALFVCFERWQHGRLPSDDDAAWRNAAHVSEAVASGDGAC
eukprot:6371031-Pyramimonas_sp.AAC.1